MCTPSQPVKTTGASRGGGLVECTSCCSSACASPHLHNLVVSTNVHWLAKLHIVYYKVMILEFSLLLDISKKNYLPASL